MKKFLSFIIILIFTNLAAQDKINLTGTVQDANYFPLPDADVNIADSKDSTLIAHTVTDENGYFSLELNPQNKAVYLLIRDDLEGDYKQSFSNLNESISFDKIIINPMVYDLNEVVIKAEASPIVVKQDTIEYNADSYKVKPNANLEALLRELPGFDIDDEGTITVNGKEITEVLIDGESFFGTDGAVAIENLPADIINKIQVSDFKTQQEKFSGQKARSNDSTLNITLKPDKKKGYMAKATVGYGTDERYEIQALLNYFKDSRRINLVASSTDIASTGLTNGFGSRGRGGMGRRSSNGITDQTSVGLNYNDKINDDLKFGLDYRFTNTNTDNENYQRVENLLPDRLYTTESNSKTSNETQTHNANANIEWTKNNSKVLFRPIFSQTENSNFTDLSEATTNNSGELRNTRIGTEELKNTSKNYSNQLTFFQKFKNKTYLNLDFNFSYSDSKSNTFTNQTTDYLDSLDIRHNQEKNNTKSNAYNFDLNYNFPITDSIQFAIGTYYSYNKDNSDVATFDFDDTTNLYSNFNDELSRLYETNLSQWNPYAQFSLNKSAFSAILKLGTNIYNQKSFGSYLDENYRVNKEEILPSLESNFSYKKRNSNWNLIYRFQTGLPTSTQLLAITNMSNTLSSFVGNPDLDPTKSHNINLQYSNFDRKSRQGINAMLGYTYNESSIINVTTIDENYVRYTTYENINGNYRINANLFWNKQYTLGTHKIRTFLGLNGSYTRQQRYIDNTLAQAFTTSFSPVIRLNWDYNDYLTISPTYNLRYTLNEYKNTDLSQGSNVTHNLGLQTIVSWPKNLSWTNDFTYSQNSQMAAGFKRNFFLWNTQIMYNFFDNKLQAGVKIYDILNQNNSYTRTVSEEAITDEQNTILRRFLMFSLTFNLNQFGGKSARNGEPPMDGPGNMPPPPTIGGPR